MKVVKATILKDIIKRRDSRINQTGVEEDVVEEEVAVGHLEKDCRVENKVEETTNLALEAEANEGFLLMTQKEIDAKNDTRWYLDSGARDASKVKVKGKGTICYLYKDDLTGSIQDVYYVPDLKATHRKMLFDTHERSNITLEGQARASDCSSRNDEKSNVQTEL
ncbi:hypothetical protein KIW84_024223 [Lathyrus oleraceus]|uniref:Uncharacterized protein n=1 Tax=Pisum sativum TaxID=3888 RepID=A0A9D4YHH0_PEA|nr:hypothetical protein KIW84_024223 [Pisum sativum]